MILDVKRLNKIVKLYYVHTLKVLWDDQGKIKIYCWMCRDKKLLSGKRSVGLRFESITLYKIS